MRLILPAADVSRIVSAVLALPARRRNEMLRDHQPAWRLVCAMDAAMIHHDALTESAWPQVERLAQVVGVDLDIGTPGSLARRRAARRQCD